MTVAWSSPLVGPVVAEPVSYVSSRPVTPRWVYLRRRVVAAAVALLLVAGALVGLGRLAGGVVAPGGDPASASGGRATTLTVHVVQPGDTLWALARRLQPEGDVRPLVHRLVELNGGSSLEVGQRIVLPG